MEVIHRVVPFGACRNGGVVAVGPVFAERDAVCEIQ